MSGPYKPMARSHGLPQRVKEQLLDQIAAGELSPGDRLPAERELAAQLGVSRNVVREALRILAAMNIVDVRQGAGVFIASLDVESLIEPLEFAISVEKSTIRLLLEARLVFEPGIARLAAERASADDIRELAELVVDSERAIDDPERFLAIDFDLHARIVRIAGNPFLSRTMESISRLAASGREFTNDSPEMRATAFADHHRIVEAISAREGETAAQVMHEHIEHVLTAFDRQAEKGSQG